MAGFAHLHVHSHYSLRDSIIQIPVLLERAAVLGMPALALTDHGVMFGAVEFYVEARRRGIKPIVGMEAYVAPGALTERPEGGIADAAHHLTLLAVNNRGYRNLMHLATVANVEGFYYRPRIDKRLLAEHQEGLVALSGCLSGEPARLIQAGRLAEARDVLAYYRDVFSAERFYVELMRTDADGQEAVNRALLELADQLGLQPVATNDAHYIERADAPLHDLFLAIGSQTTVSDPKRRRFNSDAYHLRSADEMTALFKDVPAALASTLRIAEMADIQIETGVYHYPRFMRDEGESKKDETQPSRPISSFNLQPSALLHDLARQGAIERYGQPLPAQVKERLDNELAVISRMGFVDYLLIVWDVVRFARQQGISVGPGRGSAAGSIVCYALGITEVDPIRYDLLFERFINEGRNEMPDIDIDFEPARRHEIVAYLEAKYGADCVKPIIAFSTLGPKAAIRDIVRAQGLLSAEADRICRYIPNLVSLDEALAGIPELRDLYHRDAQARQIIDLARRLEGTVRQCTVHAAGIVIADRPIVEYCPLYRNPATETVTTQYEMGSVQQVGLLKIDLLGLVNLNVIDRAVKLIRARQHDFDIARLPLDDAQTFRLFSDGETRGVFQFESAGMRRLLRQAAPSNFEDLIALNALFRPGPLQSGFTDLWVNRKHGRERARSGHPRMDEILKSTYGVIVYQEQVMRLASELAGFSLSEADRLRKAMGKKDAAIMAAYRERFVDGAASLGIARSVASRVYDVMAPFAEYGFNKSHSAAYALLAYKSGYLKANYPAEFMAALLSFEADAAKMVEYIDDARRMGLEVLPPDVNESSVGFTVVRGSIRFGLAAIKGLGDKAAEAIIEERSANGRFGDCFEFVERVDARLVNRQVLQALTKAGAFDSLCPQRGRLYEVLDAALAYAQRKQQAAGRGQGSLFAAGGEDVLRPVLPDVPEWSAEHRLAGEKEVLGFWVSDHPMGRHAADIQRFITHTLGEVADAADGEEVVVGGVIAGREIRRSRSSSQLWARLYVEDGSGRLQVIVFPSVFEKSRELIEADEPLVFKGRLGKEEDVAILKAEGVFSLAAAAEALCGRLVVVLREGSEEECLDRLKELLEQFPGPLAVTFEVGINGRRVRIRAGERLRVDGGRELLAALLQLAGVEDVRLDTRYQRRTPPNYNADTTMPPED